MRFPVPADVVLKTPPAIIDAPSNFLMSHVSLESKPRTLLLTDRREAFPRRRVQTVDRLQALLAELLPGQAERDITTSQAKAMLASSGPVTLPARPAAGSQQKSWASWSRSRPRSRRPPRNSGDSDCPLLTPGGHPLVGPVVAARSLADTGDVARFADRNRFTA